MYSGVIYKYTSPSGKSYIGQTTVSLKQRAAFNGEGYKQCSLFYKAILKYGFNNMKSEILESFEEEDQKILINKLNEAEYYYIKKNNTLAPNGYNLREGGDNTNYSEEAIICKHGSEHFNYRKDIDDISLKNYYLQGKTLREISNITGFSLLTIKRHLIDQGVFNEKKYNAPVIKYNKNMEIVKRWISASEAARDENKDPNSISRCCREKRRFYKGFTYRFEGDEI